MHKQTHEESILQIDQQDLVEKYEVVHSSNNHGNDFHDRIDSIQLVWGKFGGNEQLDLLDIQTHHKCIDEVCDYRWYDRPCDHVKLQTHIQGNADDLTAFVCEQVGYR